jgi:protein gp37
MAANSAIEWTEATWNPTTGCTKVSPGCQNCYAEIMARRLKAMGVKGYENGFALTLQPERLNEPLQRKKPSIYIG